MENEREKDLRTVDPWDLTHTAISSVETGPSHYGLGERCVGGHAFAQRWDSWALPTGGWACCAQVCSSQSLTG